MVLPKLEAKLPEPMDYKTSPLGTRPPTTNCAVVVVLCDGPLGGQETFHHSSAADDPLVFGHEEDVSAWPGADSREEDPFLKHANM